MSINNIGGSVNTTDLILTAIGAEIVDGTIQNNDINEIKSVLTNLTGHTFGNNNSISFIEGAANITDGYTGLYTERIGFRANYFSHNIQAEEGQKYFYNDELKAGFFFSIDRWVFCYNVEPQDGIDFNTESYVYTNDWGTNVNYPSESITFYGQIIHNI